MMAKAIRPLHRDGEAILGSSLVTVAYPAEAGISSASTVQAVQSPLLLGVTDGVEALVHPSQRLVENLHLFSALFVGLLGGATGTFGLHSRRTLAPQQAEVLVACMPHRLCRSFNDFESIRPRASG